MEEVANKEFQILYSSKNIIRQIESGRMRWKGHVVRTREESVQCFGRKALRDHLQDQDVDGRMRSEWILGKLAGGGGVDLIGSDRSRWRAVLNAMMNPRIFTPRS
jgi:hypothetical protein